MRNKILNTRQLKFSLRVYDWKNESDGGWKLCSTKGLVRLLIPGFISWLMTNGTQHEFQGDDDKSCLLAITHCLHPVSSFDVAPATRQKLLFFFAVFFFSPHKRNLFIAKTKKGRFDFFRKGWRREEGESGRGQIEKKKKEKQSRRNWLQSAGQNELFGSMVFLVYWFPLLTPLPRLWWSNSGWNKNERKSRNFIRFLNAAVGF